MTAMVTRRKWLRFTAFGLLSGHLVFGEEKKDQPKSPAPPAPDSKAPPPFAAIQAAVQEHFAQYRGWREYDLISKSQVADVLRELRKLGWQSPDEQEILNAVLDDQHVLVRTMRTPQGRTFLSKISSRELMLDRLDRVSGVSGGARLIQDLVKLPDGEKYAKPRSGGGVPDLLDLLPKHASGKTRRIKDYNKPTGHIYTVQDLIARLQASYEKR